MIRGSLHLPVVAGLAVLVFLAMPDLAEASLGGVVSIKRRLAQAESKVDQQARQIEGLRMSIDTRLSTVAAAENNVFIVSEGQLDDLPAAIERKRRGEPAQEPRRARVDSSYAEQVLRLLRGWEDLAESVPLPPRAGSRGFDARADPGYADRKRDWFMNVFQEEIQLVRAARNSVAHARDLSTTAVADAADAAEELIRIYESGDPPV